MRVLVTGASGFLGRQAVAALLAHGSEVHALSRRRPDSKACHWLPFDLMAASACDMQAHLALIRPSHILHLAWCVKPGAFWSDPANLEWTAATLMLARAAKAEGVQRFVGTGTCYEYDWPEAAACNEWLTPLASHSLYDTAKDATRRVLARYFADCGISFAWARPFFLFGPYEDQSRLVASLARSLVRGEPAVCSNGLVERDFLAVGEAGLALARLTLSHVEGPLNIGSGQAISVADLARLIGQLAGRPDLVHVGALPDRPGEPKRIIADISRLREELAFEPSQSREARLLETLNYWQAYGRGPG
jgi:nucleoside-diphosphate-sugar epimerase